MSARDPQRTTGDTTGYARHPPCRCRHSVVFHQLTGRPGSSLGQRRGRCGVGGPNGTCGCTRYQPAEATAGAA